MMENERWDREIQKVKTKSQVWEMVRKKRCRRKRVNEEIKMEKWEEYFRELLREDDKKRKETQRG